MALDNKILDDIKQYAVKRLTAAYGYCGCAEGADAAMLNSGTDSEDVLITIKSEKDADAAPAANSA